MDQLTIWCACGRAMTHYRVAGRGAFRCKCGARITIEVPESEYCRCVALTDGLRCRLVAVTDEPVPLCDDHARELRQIIRRDPHYLPASPRSENVSVVYYIRFSDRIKIGTTVNLRSRLASLPCDEVLAFERGGYIVERQRHAQFASLRVCGEWFSMGPDLLEHIEKLRAEPPVDVSQASAGIPRSDTVSSVRLTKNACPGNGDGAGAFLRSGGCEMPPLPPVAPDGKRWVTASQAGALLGVGPDAVHRWAAIGYIPEEAIRCYGRRKAYDLSAAADAEVKAREATERTSGSTKRAERHFASPALSRLTIHPGN